MNGATDNKLKFSTFFCSREQLSIGRFHDVPQFSLKGFTCYQAQSTAKDFIGSPYKTRKELPLPCLSDA